MKAVLLTLWLCGCQCGTEGPPEGGAVTGATSSATAVAPAPPPPRTRLGAAVALSEASDKVLVAEEDRDALWEIAMPLAPDRRALRHELEGRPAQVLPLRDRTLVTLRDPGALVVLDGALAETGRVELPADAWGVAVTPDAKTAVVTSAWTHKVSAVDLDGMNVRWTVDVPREPRAVVIPLAGDRAYVTHLVGASLTRIDGLAGDAPRVTRVELPAAPSRSPSADQVSASLSFAAVLSPDEERLFVARHALGALGGPRDWFGASTVDVLSTADDRPLAPAREAVRAPTRFSDFTNAEEDTERFGLPLYAPLRAIDGPFGAIPLERADPFVQPRAMAYRAATHTLLVASEGTDELVELDARFLEPALLRLKRYRVGSGHGKAIGVAKHCGAPSGIALTPDGTTAVVFCRSTSDVAVVPLVAVEEFTHPDDTFYIALGDEDPLLEGVAKTDPKRKFREAAVIGRKLFYNAIDRQVSGGMGCAGCHPEGRDDGHVWHEIAFTPRFSSEKTTIFLGGPALLRHHNTKVTLPVFSRDEELPKQGRARQTPMLAGRVRMKGAFGWHGESESLVARIDAGFHLHRWDEKWEPDAGAGGPAGALASFLMVGMPTPPRTQAPLDARQARGKEIFHSDAAGCTACHLPEEEFSNWTAVKVKVPPPRAGFDDESGVAFKTPSLRFVGGTPPYYHDGSVDTLADLVARIGANMGKTAHLGKEDQQALVAYLETL